MDHELRIHQKHRLMFIFFLVSLIIVSALWNSYNIYRQNIDLAQKEADAVFNKDVAYRFWATTHGGVYVPVSEKTQPNPFLSHIPERDITTPSGKKLTLMNPAYILRQTMEQFEELYGVKGHITSLKYFRPETAPDAWERAQLEQFENGVTVAKAFTTIDGEEYLRYMKPLKVQKGCLKCHAAQGYKIGDVRGGVSVSVPMAQYRRLAFGAIATIVLAHLLILAVFLTVFLIISRNYRRQIEKRRHAEREKQDIQHAFLDEARKLQLTESHLHVANWRYDLEKDELHMSKEANNIFDLDPDTNIDFNAFLQTVHPDDRDKIARQFQQLLSDKKPMIMTWRFVSPEGFSKIITAQAETVLDEAGNVTATSGLVTDISEKYFLREQFEQIHRLTDQGIALYETNDGGKSFYFKDFNPAAEAIDHIRREEVLGCDVTEVFPGIAAFGLLEVMREVYRTGRQVKTPPGKYEDGRISGWRQNTVTRLSNNEILVVYTDKTREYEQIERLEKNNREINETKEYLKTLLNTDQNIIITTEAGEDLISANSAFFDYFGYTTMEAFKEEHRCICDFFEADPGHDYLQKMNNGVLWIDYMLANPGKRYKVKMRESVFTVNVNSLPTREGRYIAVFSDITELEAYQTSLERKIAEEQEKRRVNEQILIEQSKVAAMGEMMTAIAHHWRQPLNVIALQIQDALEVYNSGEMTPEYFRESKQNIMNELKFLTHTIDDFKNFFSKEEEAESFNVKAVIDHAISLVWARADEERTDITLINGNITIIGRQNEFKQVILNLLFNAIDSIQKKHRDEPELRGKIDIYTESRDGGWQLVIRDNGTGIDEAIKDRIFEPYFTTKFQSRGTGIGLYMSKIIIEHNMNGQLFARNVCDARKRSCGAEFVIAFEA